MPKLVVGGEYADLGRNDRQKIIYVGPGPANEIFSTEGSQLVQVARTRVELDIVHWDGDLHRPLEPEQCWKRTRHDYTGMTAVILAVVPHLNTVWVMYEPVGGPSSEPKLKKEKDFRRIFGTFVGE